MEYGSATLENIAEYGMVISQIFGSEEEGYNYYNAYARSKGFGVRKEEVTRKVDTNIAFRRLYVCCKEGYRARKHFEKTERVRTPRPLSRCGCGARMEIELRMDNGEWFVKDFVDEHNHPLAKPDQTTFIRSHRGLSDVQKADVIEYGIGGLRTHQIMEVMEKDSGGYSKVGFISRDLYNFVAKYKKERIEGRDAEFVLRYMAARKDTDGEFFSKYTTDSEGHLLNIFWADTQSRIDYDAFGGVVIFDSTYRVNKYNLPFVPFIGVNHHRSTTVFGFGIVSDETEASFVWLLEAFLESTKQKHPRSVITDGDHAMAKAIAAVLPNTDHRLCSWHIEQNMIRNLRKQKLKDFRKFVYHIWDVDEFEKRWVEFMVDYDISEKDAWIMRMYELRKKWSRAYTKGRYFLGMQSNQRSESLNSRLHKNLDRRMSLVDLLEHSDHCLSRIRKNEAELDATASDTVPFTELAADPLEKSAALIYTPVMFKKVKQQIEQFSKWEVTEVTKNDDVVLYTVARKESRHATLTMRVRQRKCSNIFLLLSFKYCIS
uniref:Protein FAR1-RELATED SEQUENCE n=1 Tax=Hordeum vulgare subsp. vulgare TaxID=112509 RepID=A0A8I6Y6F0_HORVV